MKKSHIRNLLLIVLTALTTALFNAGSPAVSARQNPSIKNVSFNPDDLPAPRIDRQERVRKASKSGKAPLTLTLVLNRTDQKGFDDFLSAVQDPRSPMFHRYMTPEEQADRFGPSKPAYDEIAAWVRRKGFSLVEGSANRLTMTIRGTRKAAEKLFGLKIIDYRIGDKDFYASNHEPVIPADLRSYVQAIVGFSNLAQPYPSNGKTNFTNGFCLKDAALKAVGELSFCYAQATQAQQSCDFNTFYQPKAQECLKGPDPNNGSNGPGSPGAGSRRGSVSSVRPDINLSASQLKSNAAMVPNWTNVDGSGQKVGLLEFDTFNINDIKDYLDLVGLPASDINRLSKVDVNGGATLGPEEAEVLIDIIAVMQNARGAQVIVYNAPFTNIHTSFQTLFNRMITDHVTVISNSWVYCEDQTNAADALSIDSVLASAAAAGISVLNSTGDFGSTCVDGSANTASLPASSPHATAVGGTSLTLGPASTYANEFFWNGLNNTPPTGTGGFGTSRFFARPAYQTGFVASPNRSIPDLAVHADPTNGIFICQADAGGCPTGSTYGGTSLSAPIWAAFVALLNQVNGQNLGELNPKLYPLGNSNAFHSPASIGSDFQHVGLGSPNLNEMYRSLSGKSVGPVSGAVSEIKADPRVAVADGNSEAIVVVRLRDAEGNSVSGKTVTLTANAGSHATITPASGVSNVANGAVIFSIKNTVTELSTLTAIDTTDGVTLSKTVEVAFISRPASAGSITATPATVAANGTDKTTITVTLQDANGNPSPGKLVSLSQGNGGSIVSGTTALTDATGKVQFTAVDFNSETVTYTAVDVTDRNVPVPGSATVNFTDGTGFCARPMGTGAAGYSAISFASNFPLDCFSGIAPFGVAFDANGILFVSDFANSSIYKFGPEGGIAGPATLVGTIPPAVGAGTTGLAFTKDGKLYGGLYYGNKVVEINPVTGAVVREIAVLQESPLDLRVDPLSGDLFVSEYSGIFRITNLNNAAPTVTLYAAGGAIDGFEFANDGTIFLKGGTTGVYRATGTNTANPGTVSFVIFVGSGPDGIAIEPNPANPSNPVLLVNRNDGIITRIDTSAIPANVVNCVDAGAPCTDIFTGGTRGDLATVGPNGCLYATQSDRVIKLTKADGTCSLTPSNPAPQLVLTPENVQPSPAQGTTVTLTAQLRNVAALSNIPITLFVSGANNKAILVKTDATGKAVFTYTGVEAGLDKAYASAEVAGKTLISNDSKVTWTAGKHSSFLTLNLSPTTGSSGKTTTLKANLTDFSNDPATPAPGQTVQFTVAGQNCSGTTDANGSASCSIVTPSTPGTYPLTASFAGSNTLLASSDSSTFTITAALPTGPEGDINRSDPGAPDSSDGVVDLKDLQWYDNFVNGTFIPAQGGAAQPLAIGPTALENQKRDVSPTDVFGDGCLNAADRQQMVLFALGIATSPGPAAGPTVLNQCPPVRPAPSADTRKARPGIPFIDGSISRSIRIIPGESRRTSGSNSLSVELDAVGNETKVMFTIEFDPKALTIDSASFPGSNSDITLGNGVPAGASLAVNANEAALGRVVVLVSFNSPIMAGRSKNIVNITFRGGENSKAIAYDSVKIGGIQAVSGSGTELPVRILKDERYSRTLSLLSILSTDRTFEEYILNGDYY